MNFIINPNTFEKYSIFSKEGTLLLKKYVKLYQSGGAEEGGATKPVPLLTEQQRFGGMSLVPRRKSGSTCPIYVDPEKKQKYLAIHDYDEKKAEENGYNPLLVNEEIRVFLLEQTEPTIMTWVLLAKPQGGPVSKPGQMPAKDLYTLVAVHNESSYEFSAKHDTILDRLFSGEKYKKIRDLGQNPYYASGELSYTPEKELLYNLQSGTYYNQKVMPKGVCEEDADAEANADAEAQADAEPEQPCSSIEDKDQCDLKEVCKWKNTYNLDAAKMVIGTWLRELLNELPLKFHEETFP